MRKFSKKTVALVVSLALLLCIGIGGMLAYLLDESDPVENTFIPSQVTTDVSEERNGDVKSDVKIKNTGDTTAYIRAAVVVTWQNADGAVYGQAPILDTDYTISYNTSTEAGTNKWIKSSDGFYYWTSPVKSDDEDAQNCETGILITTCKPIKAAPAEGYFLNVEIIGSGIQSVPTSVVTTQWDSGVSGVNGDTLTIKQ